MELLEIIVLAALESAYSLSWGWIRFEETFWLFYDN